MNTFTSHVPGFCDYDRPAPVVFNTTEELLALGEVRRLCDIAGFSHFALSQDCLMVVLATGEAYVAGFVKHPERVSLPQWEEQA